jgi:predicted RNase H-like HicB family nuclease
MEYVILIRSAGESGFWAEVPALDGGECFIQGESIEEILRDAPDAIASHLDALAAFGDLPRHRETILIATVQAPTAA